MRGLIFLFLFSFLFSKEYFLSLRMASINNSLISYKFEYSKALTPSYKSCKVVFSFFTDLNRVEDILKTQKEKIVSNLLKSRVFVYSNSDISNIFYEKSKISVLPKRFDIIIKNSKVYFCLKEEG